MYKTLVYNPDVKVEIISNGQLYDISRDVVGGSIRLNVNSVSNLSLTVANKDLRYTNRFRRMDRIQVHLKRISWVKVFTGYLNSVPVIQLYPGTINLTASCTLKRLQYTYWDTGLDASMDLMDQVAADEMQAEALDQTGTNVPADQDTSAEDTSGSGTSSALTPDAGLGTMLKRILVEVGKWEEDDVHIQDVPTSFQDYLSETLDEYDASEAAEKFKDLFGWNESISTGGGGGGGGDMGEATFTSIGPPANGSNYTMDELVSIVSHAGWSGDDVAIGASIIMAESGGNPGAVNTANSNGTIDRGLWQINSIHEAKLKGGSWFDPAVSTRMAREIYQEAGNSWQPWSTFSYFGSNAKHLADARAAVARGIGPLPAGSKEKGSGSGGKSSAGKASGTVDFGKADSNDKRDEKGKNSKPSNTADSPTPPPQVYETGHQWLSRVNLGDKEPNTSQMTVSDSIAAVALYKFPMMTYISGERYTDNAYHSKKMAADISNGGDEGTREMKELAQWWYDNFLGKGLQELIHSPFNNNVGADQNVGDGMSQYYNPGTMSEHRNHVHVAMLGRVSADGTSDGNSASVGGGGAGINFENKLGKSLFNYIFDPGSLDQGGLSQTFTGERAPVNDVPLLDTVSSICQSSMRQFQSAPDGSFVAFYPDYFGLDGTEAVLKLEDIELKNFHIDANDDALSTHVYIMGGGSSLASANIGEYGWLETSGVATVENKWLFERLTKHSVAGYDVGSVEELLGRYGVRPLKLPQKNVTTAEMEFLSAANLFMRKWAEQYRTSVDFTFMPELFPGMRVELVSHNVTVYVDSVTHNFSYEGSGFSTSASVMAPSATTGTVQGLPTTSDTSNTTTTISTDRKDVR